MEASPNQNFCGSILMVPMIFQPHYRLPVLQKRCQSGVIEVMKKMSLSQKTFSLRTLPCIILQMDS